MNNTESNKMSTWLPLRGSSGASPGPAAISIEIAALTLFARNDALTSHWIGYTGLIGLHIRLDIG